MFITKQKYLRNIICNILDNKYITYWHPVYFTQIVRREKLICEKDKMGKAFQLHLYKNPFLIQIMTDYMKKQCFYSALYTSY